MLFISTLETAPSNRPASKEPIISDIPVADSQVVTGLGVEEASELLDWLEGRGIVSPKIEADATGHLTICWREPDQN
ncbi:MAG: hypothetical protein N2112_09815 [Gemmataceae bacterium]|nr:hypothetical protein [Gemmataceae bacterium]